MSAGLQGQPSAARANGKLDRAGKIAPLAPPQPAAGSQTNRSDPAGGDMVAWVSTSFATPSVGTTATRTERHRQTQVSFQNDLRPAVPVLITCSIKHRIDTKALTLHHNQLTHTILSPNVLDCGWLEKIYIVKTYCSIISSLNDGRITAWVAHRPPGCRCPARAPSRFLSRSSPPPMSSEMDHAKPDRHELRADARWDSA